MVGCRGPPDKHEEGNRGWRATKDQTQELYQETDQQNMSEEDHDKEKQHAENKTEYAQGTYNTWILQNMQRIVSYRI